MNSKTKNNILIIVIVILTALAVIALVLVTGFSRNGNGAGNSSASEQSAGSADMSDTPGQGGEESSEPISVPAESSASESTDSSPSDETGEQIAALASSLVGVPFVENGSTPSGFDNSGLIYYVLRENGYISCPRTTEAQSGMGSKIGRDSLKTGDLVFFGNGGSGTADFGGIYIGGGRMIACLMPGTNVKEVDITTDYYVSNFYGGISLS